LEFSGIILFVVGFIIGGAAVWFLRQKELESIQDSQEQLKDAFGNLSKEALDANLDSFLKLAESKFSDLVGKSDEQLGKKKELIDSTLKEMKSDLKSLSDNTIALKSQMEESRKSVGELSDTTSQLRQILSSSQARGQWGERMVKDILDFIGLVEGINYSKQSQVSDGTERPDFTFFLPDDKSLNMDVKFPLAHYEKYLAADNELEKEAEKKAFLADVRNRVKEVSKRGYIDPKGSTVDYVLLFIPNESIYAFLNQEDSGLIDFSLEKKIMLCSPITLYAVLSLIRQAVSNFAMEQKAGEVQAQVGVFAKQWIKFIEKLDALGKTLGTVSTHYDELRGTRLRALEKPMDKIKDMQLGGNDIKEIEE
jgi:DNA recombination protein RmuC